MTMREIIQNIYDALKNANEYMYGVVEISSGGSVIKVRNPERVDE